MGQGLTVDFSHPTELVEIDAVEEGRFGSDGWMPGRSLNGDERLRILPTNELGLARVRLLRPR